MRPHFLLWAAVLSLSLAAGGAHAQPPGKPFPPGMKPGMPLEGKPFGPPPQLDVGWIDVHVHLLGGRERDFHGAVREAAAIMGSAGIRAMVLMSPPNVSGSVALYDTADFVGAIRRYPGRFAFLGGGGTLNPMLQRAAGGEVSEALRKRFEDAAGKIVAQGAAGFGELAAHHLSHLPDHPYESVAADMARGVSRIPGPLCARGRPVHRLALRTRDRAGDAVFGARADDAAAHAEVPLPAAARARAPARLRQRRTAVQAPLEHCRSEFRASLVTGSLRHRSLFTAS